MSKCKYCEGETTGGEECSNCWEIRHRIEQTQGRVVMKILRDVYKPVRGAFSLIEMAGVPESRHTGSLQTGIDCVLTGYNRACQALENRITHLEAILSDMGVEDPSGL